MQEWVDTLRLKLREMKILSPKENLYSKLPEHRPPLLPTRDPMSPLPATPPVPAAIVPGVERVVAVSSVALVSRHTNATNTEVISTTNTAASVATSSATATTAATTSIVATTILSAATISATVTTTVELSTTTTSVVQPSASQKITSSSSTAAPSTSMSNTLSQNLINLLSNPVSTYSSHLSSIQSVSEIESIIDDSQSSDMVTVLQELTVISANETSTASNASEVVKIKKSHYDEEVPSLAKTFANNVLADPNPSTSGLSSYASPVKRDLNEHKTIENDLGE